MEGTHALAINPWMEEMGPGLDQGQRRETGIEEEVEAVAAALPLRHLWRRFLVRA